MTDKQGHLDVLDGRFPRDAGGEPSPVFDALIRGAIKGGMDPKFLEDEMKRAAEQATVAAIAGEERFIQPLPPRRLPQIDVSPAALPPPQIPVTPLPYQELAEARLEHEFNEGPGTVVLDRIEDGPPKAAVAVRKRAPVKTRQRSQRRPGLRRPR